MCLVKKKEHLAVYLNSRTPRYRLSVDRLPHDKSRICYFLVINDSLYRRFRKLPFFRQSRERQYWGVDCTNTRTLKRAHTGYKPITMQYTVQ